MGSTGPALRVLAAAKINLALHVTGRRGDGYHLLDSLVAFADIGDFISVRGAAELRLRVTGPMADDVPDGGDNLVLRAARALDPARGAEITLEKHLPVASGIGGGSADAAACLRALSDLWQVPLPAQKAVLGLGADVPVCLAGGFCRMRGIGEVLEQVKTAPVFHAVLVNPGFSLSTPVVFSALKRRDNPALGALPRSDCLEDWVRFLGAARNDLEGPATLLMPEITEVLTALKGQEGCVLARMSGSGATCFGLFSTKDQAQKAADDLIKGPRNWWVAKARLG